MSHPSLYTSFDEQQRLNAMSALNIIIVKTAALGYIMQNKCEYMCLYA